MWPRYLRPPRAPRPLDMAGRSFKAHRLHRQASDRADSIFVADAMDRLAGAGAVGGQHHRRSHSEVIMQSSQPRCKEVTGEIVGGLATASCLLPCAVMEVAVLATVRAPVALCRRAVRVKRRHRAASVGQAEMYKLLEEDGMLMLNGSPVAWPAAAPAEEAEKLEQEVWAIFHNAGFGRCPPQLDDEIS